MFPRRRSLRRNRVEGERRRFGETRDVGDANLAESTACDLVPIDVRAAALAIESESSADSIARARPRRRGGRGARALAASPNPRSAYSTPAFGCSALRLQLRAVSVLVDTQRRKHARRLAELRERHVEADVRRAAEAHLLSFAEDRKRVARDAEEEKAARSDRRRRRRWEPPAAACFSARAPPRGVITSTCVRESFQRCVQRERRTTTRTRSTILGRVPSLRSDVLGA